MACLVGVLSAQGATGVNYDTAWTFVHDGGKDSASGFNFTDIFYDVKVLPNNTAVCVGTSAVGERSILIKLDSNGNVIQLKRFVVNSPAVQLSANSAHSISMTRNGDLLVGGVRYSAPWVMRLDSSANVKWAAWYYDSTKGLLGQILAGPGNVNSVLETSHGKIVCVAGDEYPNNYFPLESYAAYLELDSNGVYHRIREWSNPAGYDVGGFCQAETREGNFLLSGNQSVLFIDANGLEKWKMKYTFQLPGVGSKTNNVNRAKVLRDGTFFVAGQAYEGTCWTLWQRLNYDAWWTPITNGGSPVTWDTAGDQGGDDVIYDFTQLKNGNLVFVGQESSVTGDHDGLWTFVTDSTGKKILWEKVVKIVYRTGFGNRVYPLSVCATPDGGFTVVGYIPCGDANGGKNAFAAHFVPKAISLILNHSTPLHQTRALRHTITCTTVVFTSDMPIPSSFITIYNASGKTVAGISGTRAGSRTTSFAWDFSRVGRGVYFYKAGRGNGAVSGKLVVGQ